MRAEDIKVGMWLRDPNGEPVRVVRVEPGSEFAWVVVKYLAPERVGRRWARYQLEPWTPQVGEWVRLDTIDPVDQGGRRGKVGRVREVKYGIAFIEDSVAGLLSPRAGHYHVEPCLPPAPPTTHLRADGVEVPVTNTLNGLVSSTYNNTTEEPTTVFMHGTNDPAKWHTDAVAEAQSEAIYRQWMESRPRAKEAAKVEFKPVAAPCGPVVMHANSTCLKCGGPAYVGLQEARCLAPKCERVELEPTYVERVMIGGGPLAGMPGEWGYRAGCLRMSVIHPIREEAIRLWREAVSK